MNGVFYCTVIRYFRVIALKNQLEIFILEVHPPTTTTESTTQIITEKPRRKNRKRNRKRQRERHREQHQDQQDEDAPLEEISEEGQVIEEVNHISFIINEDKG